MVTANAGSTTPSIAEASTGRSNWNVRPLNVNSQLTSMSRGSRVRRDGTIAMSSNP